MTTETHTGRVGLFQALKEGARAGITHWRWLTLSGLGALLLGFITALPLVRQVKASLGFNPAGASTDLGSKIQAWVETLRAFSANPQGMGAFISALFAAVALALFYKVWLTSGLVGSVRRGRALGFRELVRVANAGFWPQLKQSLLFAVMFVVLALPAVFTFRWLSGVRKVATAAAEVEHASLVFNGVVLVTLFIFVVWFELARAKLANLSEAQPRVRSTVKQGFMAAVKRPIAVLVCFVLFLALGAAALALLTLPAVSLHNAWLASALVALATMAGAAFRVMRLASLARIVR